MVTRPKVMFDGVELFAGRECLCPDCEKTNTVDPEPPFEKLWRKNVPEDYHKATPERVRESLRGALAWRPGRQKGIGIYGPSNSGKTHALALAVRGLERIFRWTTGPAMRQLAIDAAMLDGEDRAEARKRLATLRDTPLLVIDDIAEAKFTEAWTDKLFEILEHRNGRRLITCWTAQHGPGQLCRIIGGSSGEALERRLCQDHALFSA